ncbi:MAG: hypothetical protein LBC86_07630 [Oscillospiraceae bacterium]|jgi:hypothetical protein|nr:hypothetical protein [Oscillospiraceae bacterium]
MFVDADRGVPLGLGMALAQNNNALSHFAGLPLAERQAIIERTHGINSKKEMKSFVDNLSKNWDKP